MGGAVAMDLAAFGALMNDDKSLFGVGLGTDRFHLPLTLTGAVSRIDVYVERPKAKGTVVARGVAERLHGLFAMCADKSVVVFCEPFLLHNAIVPFLITIKDSAQGG